MGTFDSLHMGNRCGQTKALGKGLADLVPGDPVVLHSVPVFDPDNDVERDWLELTAQPAITDFQLRAFPPMGVVRVRSGRLLDWIDDPEPDLPIFDNLGNPEDPGKLQRSLEQNAAALAHDASLLGDLDTADADSLEAFLSPDTHVSLADLRQRGDAEAIERRVQELTGRLREERAGSLGLPGDCPVCEWVRAGGPAAGLRPGRSPG